MKSGPRRKAGYRSNRGWNHRSTGPPRFRWLRANCRRSAAIQTGRQTVYPVRVAGLFSSSEFLNGLALGENIGERRGNVVAGKRHDRKWNAMKGFRLQRFCRRPPTFGGGRRDWWRANHSCLWYRATAAIPGLTSLVPFHPFWVRASANCPCGRSAKSPSFTPRSRSKGATNAACHFATNLS